jgi:Flp pilus assembly protein TadD
VIRSTLSLAVILGAVTILTAAPLRADTRDDNRAACQSKDPDTAIAACTADIVSGAETTPADLAIAYYDRGLSYTAKQDYENAIADLTEAISLNPDDKNYYDERGVAYQSTNRNSEATADYRAALGIDPDDDMAQNNLEVMGVTP